MIDKVHGIVETRRPDAKNAQYNRIIKEGDVLLSESQACELAESHCAQQSTYPAHYHRLSAEALADSAVKKKQVYPYRQPVANISIYMIYNTV